MLHNCFWRNSDVLKGQCSCLQRGWVSLSLPQRECGNVGVGYLHPFTIPLALYCLLLQVQSIGRGAMCVWPRCFDSAHPRLTSHGFLYGCAHLTSAPWASATSLPCALPDLSLSWGRSPVPPPLPQLLLAQGTVLSVWDIFISLCSAVKSGLHLCSPGEVCPAGQGWDRCALRVSTNRHALSCLLSALRTEIKQQ